MSAGFGPFGNPSTSSGIVGSTSSGIVLRRRSLLLGGLGALTACAQVPTSGPVEQVSPSAQASVERGVQVRPAPPRPDGSPEVVMAGFIDAMASLEPDFQVARQYLAPAVAVDWDPASGVTVFDGDRRTNLSSTQSAALQAPLVGRLDAAGHFSAVRGTLKHDFGMVQVDGQWRIGRPPQGLLVSSYTLLHRFSAVPVWFLDAAGERVVPELVWLSQAPATETQLVQALLRGPSEWLRPAVATAIPADTRLAAPAVTVDKSGLAEVALSEAVGELPDRQRGQLAAQLLWTLRRIGGAQRLRISVNGKTLALPGGSDDGSVGAVDVMGWSPVSQAAGTMPFALVKGVVGRMDTPDHVTPVSGPLGRKGWPQEVVRFAAHEATGSLAVVDRAATILAVGPADRDGLQTWFTGTGLGRPQFSGTGEVWLVADGAGRRPTLRRVTARGKSAVVQVALPAGHALVGFSLSPDRCRMAVISQVGQQRVLGMCIVHGSDQLAAVGHRPLPLADSQDLAWVTDVAWATPTSLLVLAAPDRVSHPSVVQVGCDGAQLEALGPIGDAEPTELVVQPTLDQIVAGVITKSHAFLGFQSAWRWQGTDLAVTTAAYAR